MKSPEPPVLRCSHCNKPFDKASSLKRHGYYCLSTKVGRKPRLRSCIACAAAKARCSHDRPDCRRCVAKATRCQYPDETPTGAATPKRAEHQWGSTTTGDGATEATGILTPSMSSVMQQDAFDFSDAASHGAGGFSDSVSNAIWDDMFIPGDGPPTSMQQSSLGGKGFDSALSAFLHEDAGSPILFAASGLPRFQMNLSPPDSISIPRTPSYAMRSLVSRPRHMAKTKRVASLIFHTFKSYLVMMLRHKTLPPFIHPHFQKLGVPETQLEPVLNCINLMRMIGGGMPGCRKLFWTNVRLECQRLSTQTQIFSQWELVSAMQVLFIYVLVRIDEGETEHNNVDFMLLRAVSEVAQHLSISDAAAHTHCSLCNSELEVTWEDWAFRESRRRLSVVYRVINMLIDFEPAANCTLPSALKLAPLPAKRRLWEATDATLWKQSYHELGPEIIFGLAADGELVEVDDDQLSCADAWLTYTFPDGKTPSMHTQSWDEWLAGIDSFGGLVMLAASLDD